MAEDPVLESASASRQKSCNACVRAKRGCDKRHPSCSRCNEKQIPCAYVKRTHGEAFESGIGFDFGSVDLDMPWEGLTGFLSSKSSDLILPDTATWPRSDTSHLSSFDALNDPFLASKEVSSTALRDMQLVNGSSAEVDEPQEREQALGNFDYTSMADICIQYEPWHVYDPTTKAHYIVQTIKSYPGTFSRENRTAWMHKYLYKDQMPSSVRSCFTVSSLYSNMTNGNKTSVFRVLCQSLDELKQQQFPNTPQEKLGRVQALVLYQIICLFDGDLTLRSNADRDMSLLQDWVDELCKIRENLETSEIASNASVLEAQNPPRSWEWWIFSESVRRTIVMVYVFLGLWSLMSKNTDDKFFGAWKYQNRWTISRPLWDAPSSFDFFQIWKSKAHYVNENFEFEKFLKSGRAGDVDDFSKLLIVACVIRSLHRVRTVADIYSYMGLDETKQWFTDQGSVF